MARSDDLVNWEYVGDAITDSNRPSWAAPESSFWAPDIRQVNGTYLLYFVATETTVTDECCDNAIGVMTGPTPTGPWTDSGEPLVGPRRGDSGDPGDFKWTFDPSGFTGKDGTRYLYYGSYYGGVFVTELSADGTRAVGQPTMVLIDNRYEGSYVVRHGGFYYIFASAADCCAGPTTGYSVFAGRSRSPRGPFIDRNGVSLRASRVGGTPVIMPNGNKWVGTGHNAVVTDLAGQDFLVYHAIDRKDPYLNEPFGINERPMLLDRLDWVNGWPTVRGGRWASSVRQPAPVARFDLGSEFNRQATLGDRWRRVGGDWRLVKPGPGRGHVEDSASCTETSYLVTEGAAPKNVRAEADLSLRSVAPGSGSVGLVAAYRGRGNHVAAHLDKEAGALVTQTFVNGTPGAPMASPLPASFRFGALHNVAMEIRGTRLSVEVTDARLGDPVVSQRREIPAAAAQSGSVGVNASCARARADNVGASRLFVPSQSTAGLPRTGVVDPGFSDEFNDTQLEPQWSFVRDPDGQETGGVYRWPTQDADINRENNSASLLLRRAPQGRYTVKTKLSIDLGVDTVRNFQQGGLVVYAGDDRYIKLVHVAIWNTRQTEFAKERPFADGVAYGGMVIGPPADVTYLRISHRIDPRNGEHEYRAATRTDGEPWTRGGVWTLAAGTKPRIGLLSMGGAGATSEFDYFRVTRP
jgi:arabinan endo-1,5-alpha-L-arabinosidase